MATHKKSSKAPQRIVKHNGARAIAHPRRKARRDLPSTQGVAGTLSRLTSSWLISGLSSDAEIRQFLWEARARCRSLERENDYVRKFLTELESNVVGPDGVVLQMKITEEADRVIHEPDEKAFIEAYEREFNEKRKRSRQRLVRKGCSEPLARELRPDIHLLRNIDGAPLNGQSPHTRVAKVLKGQPDVYANNLIENGWKVQGRQENFTASRVLDRFSTERLHIRSTARDGACLIRMIKGFDNEFGFAIQLIDTEWLDVNYNVVLPNGNEVRMGVEFNQWREPVAYHVLVRNSGQWNWGSGLMGLGGPFASTPLGSTNARQRIDAKEILHPFIHERIDQSREIPWLISAVTRLKMLGKYEEAELVASMAAACKIAVRYSEMLPDNYPADAIDLPNPLESHGETSEMLEPGMIENLEWGEKMQLLNPTHPNGNYGDFRKGVLRGVAAGLPGATYYGISQDLEAVNFSSMRGGELSARDAWMMVQNWEIKNGFHTPIFEPWLESALMSGKIPLPISKFDKFNQPYFIGRRWKGIDPIKEAEANRANILLASTTRTKIAAESGYDFEEIIDQLAVEEDLLEALGLEALLLKNMQPMKVGSDSTSDGSNPGDGNKPDAEEETANKEGLELSGSRLSQD